MKGKKGDILFFELVAGTERGTFYFSGGLLVLQPKKKLATREKGGHSTFLGGWLGQNAPVLGKGFVLGGILPQPPVE